MSYFLKIAVLSTKRSSTTALVSTRAKQFFFSLLQIYWFSSSLFKQHTKSYTNHAFCLTYKSTITTTIEGGYQTLQQCPKNMFYSLQGTLSYSEKFVCFAMLDSMWMLSIPEHSQLYLCISEYICTVCYNNFKWFNKFLWGPFLSLMNPNIILLLVHSSNLTWKTLPTLSTNLSSKSMTTANVTGYEFLHLMSKYLQREKKSQNKVWWWLKGNKRKELSTFMRKKEKIVNL